MALRKKPAKTSTPAVSKARGKNGELNDAQVRFCEEYVVDWNGTRAAKRAGYSPKSASIQAYDLLRNPKIKAKIGQLQRKAAEKLQIDHTDILKRLWETASGDVNDLVRLERRCCRHCHGAGHAYQYTTPREYSAALDRFALDQAKEKVATLAELAEMRAANVPIPGQPTDDGGYGFDKTATPNPECPECMGEGIETVHVADTREALSHPLYQGVKQTKDGIEVKIADQAKALEQVARHMSFFKDAMQLNASDELLEAARKINAASPPLDAKYMKENASRLMGDEGDD